MFRCGAGVALSTVVLLLMPAPAGAASSGEILRAEVNAQWTTASIAGVTVRSTDCVPREPLIEPPEWWESFFGPPILPESEPWECGSIPYATLGPGSSSADCASSNRDWGAFGPGVQLVWSGSELQGNGGASFDLAQVSLVDGSQAPLLCLSAIEAEEGVVCMAVGCPRYAIVHATYQLDSAELQVVASLDTPRPGHPHEATEPAPTIESPPARKACHRPSHTQKPEKRKRIGLTQRKSVTGHGRHVRRCKTG